MPGKKLIEVSQFGDFPTTNKSADATEAMQKTIDAAAEAGSGAVAYFPPGTYYISKALQVKGSDFWVSGANDLATMIKWNAEDEATSEGMIQVGHNAQSLLSDSQHMWQC